MIIMKSILGTFSIPGRVINRSVLEEMEVTLGLKVAKKLQTYSWFAVYDFESVLRNIPQDRDGNGDSGTEHTPVCIR